MLPLLVYIPVNTNDMRLLKAAIKNTFRVEWGWSGVSRCNIEITEKKYMNSSTLPTMGESLIISCRKCENNFDDVIDGKSARIESLSEAEIERNAQNMPELSPHYNKLFVVFLSTPYLLIQPNPRHNREGARRRRMNNNA